MIEMNNVAFFYGRHKPVLRDFSMRAESGSRICFYGPSGCGKTTVLRLLMGLEKPRRGTVSVPQNTAFSAVFQEDRLLPWKTILENTAFFSNEKAAEAMLVRLGLKECMNRRPEELSGGMKRRAALARALCHPFDVLVLDEAFTGLDEDIKRVCFQAVEEKMEGKSLFMVTHDLSEADVLGAEYFSMPQIRA